VGLMVLSCNPAVHPSLLGRPRFSDLPVGMFNDTKHFDCRFPENSMALWASPADRVFPPVLPAQKRKQIRGSSSSRPSRILNLRSSSNGPYYVNVCFVTPAVKNPASPCRLIPIFCPPPSSRIRRDRFSLPLLVSAADDVASTMCHSSTPLPPTYLLRFPRFVLFLPLLRKLFRLVFLTSR